MLLELELPRLLAPDLPSNWYSLKGLDCTHSNYQTLIRPVLLFFVTTSPCRDWVICAPAAFLGSSSRFSGSFSGVKPWFSVTRYHRGSPLYYHRKLIGQIFEWTIASTKGRAIRKVIMNHHWKNFHPPKKMALAFESNKYIPPSTIKRTSQDFMHVLALDLPRLSK